VHSGIDYNHLYQINNVLSQTDLCWDMSFTASLQFVTPSSNTVSLSLHDIYSVKVRVDSENVIETLIDKKEFSVAYAYAKIVGAASDQISVKEVILSVVVMIVILFWITANPTFFVVT